MMRMRTYWSRSTWRNRVIICFILNLFSKFTKEIFCASFYSLIDIYPEKHGLIFLSQNGILKDNIYCWYCTTLILWGVQMGVQDVYKENLREYLIYCSYWSQLPICLILFLILYILQVFFDFLHILTSCNPSFPHPSHHLLHSSGLRSSMTS